MVRCKLFAVEQGEHLLHKRLGHQPRLLGYGGHHRAVRKRHLFVRLWIAVDADDREVVLSARVADRRRRGNGCTVKRCEYGIHVGSRRIGDQDRLHLRLDIREKVRPRIDDLTDDLRVRILGENQLEFAGAHADHLSERVGDQNDVRFAFGAVHELRCRHCAHHPVVRLDDKIDKRSGSCIHRRNDDPSIVRLLKCRLGHLDVALLDDDRVNTLCNKILDCRNSIGNVVGDCADGGSAERLDNVNQYGSPDACEEIRLSEVVDPDLVAVGQHTQREANKQHHQNCCTHNSTHTPSLSRVSSPSRGVRLVRALKDQGNKEPRSLDRSP